MQPGLLRGFDVRDNAVAFDAFFGRITGQLYWCCSSDEGIERAEWPYALPPPLAGECAWSGAPPGGSGGCLLWRMREMRCLIAPHAAGMPHTWRPLPADGQAVPWQPPVLQLPAYCDDPGLSEADKEIVAFANHPCQFLRNATAAALAAALS